MSKRRAMEKEKDIENGWTGEPPLWTELSKSLLQQWNMTKAGEEQFNTGWHWKYLAWRANQKGMILWQKRHKTHDLSSFFWWRWWTQPVSWPEYPTERAKRAVRMQWAIGNLEMKIEHRLKMAWLWSLTHPFGDGKTTTLKLWLFAYLVANTLEYYSRALLWSVYGKE